MGSRSSAILPCLKPKPPPDPSGRHQNSAIAPDRHAEAEPLYRRALAIDEKSFGPDHPNVATGLNNLARLLTATNRHAEVDSLYRRALAIFEKSLGPDHPKLARVRNNLTSSMRDANLHPKAEAM
jgi:tetratricopeptide (TPR) repeat protein